MRQIKIEKVTLNIGCGDDKNKLDRATKLLEKLTERKPVVTLSKKRSTFGMVKGKPIGVKVTLRGKLADDFFKIALNSVENKIRAKQLDSEGNINIGVREYIDLPGVKYSHDVGMLGLDVAVTLKRPGYRIKYRKIQQRNIPTKHKINKEEVLSWLKQMGAEIIE